MISGPGTRRRPGTSGLALAVVGLTLLLVAAPARAQLTDPCALECALVLGGASFAVGMATTTVAGRARGGHTTVLQGAAHWTFGAFVGLGAGAWLSGDGERQERAVYGAGIGTITGGLAGFALESLAGESTPATRVASLLVGAGLGALAGGAFGALTHDGETGTTTALSGRRPTPLVLRIGL